MLMLNFHALGKPAASGRTADYYQETIFLHPMMSSIFENPTIMNKYSLSCVAGTQH